MDLETVEIDCCNLRDLTYMHNPSRMDPPGQVANQLVNLLRMGFMLAPYRAVIPDAASMRLVEVSDRTNMLLDPTLVFYFDTP